MGAWRQVASVRSVLLTAALEFLAASGHSADPLVVIPNVIGNSTTTKFGDGYITRTSDGTTYNTSKFGSGWITRSSDGKTYTTSKFGDGAITRGNGEQVTTSRFGSGTINRSSNGKSTTTSKFGSGWLSRASGSSRDKEKGQVRVIPTQGSHSTPCGIPACHRNSSMSGASGISHEWFSSAGHLFSPFFNL